MEYLVVILIWQFGKSHNEHQIKCKSFLLQAWASYHTVLKTANLKSCQEWFYRKLPNLSLANNSGYMVY